MAQNYTRQSSLSDGDTITASLFNDEYNQLVNAFTYSSTSASSTGHRHDGSSGQGGNIFKIGDLDFLNKIEVDSTNNRWGFYVEVSSAAVEQIRIQDGSIVPVTDNDIDLGTASLEFKDLFIDGTAHIDTLDVDENATVAGTLGVTGTTTLTGNVTTTNDLSVGGNLTVTGTTTFNGGTITMGDAATDNVVFGADVDSNIIPDDDDTYDLGSSSQEWRNLYIDGTANIDSLVADTADINGGTIDGTVIGGTTPAAVSATTVSATGNITVGGTVDGRDVATDGTKLDTVETNADVTDTANVTAAGALMDSELTSEASVKALNQGVATTDSPTFAGLTTTATVSFGDNDKAIFGAGSDLEIYSDGSTSYIREAGPGNLRIAGAGVQITDASFNKYFLGSGDVARLYHSDAEKLATTATGIDVTGSITTDGLTVDASTTDMITLNHSTSVKSNNDWARLFW